MESLVSKSPLRQESVSTLNSSPPRVMSPQTKLSAADANRIVTSAAQLLIDSANQLALKAGQHVEHQVNHPNTSQLNIQYHKLNFQFWSQRKKMSDLNTQQHTIEPLESQTVNESKFPDPFKCRGDFCNLSVQPSGPLQPAHNSMQHIQEKLFTEKELVALRKDKRFAAMMVGWFCMI